MKTVTGPIRVELTEQEIGIVLHAERPVVAARDVFGAPLATEAHLRLKQCGDRLAEFTDAVFQALHQF